MPSRIPHSPFSLIRILRKSLAQCDARQARHSHNAHLARVFKKDPKKIAALDRLAARAEQDANAVSALIAKEEREIASARDRRALKLD